VSFGYDAAPASLAPDVLIDHFGELFPAIERLLR
jgi:hypothetical protein